MKRKFLEDLGLEKEIIDKIMDENGNDINAAKKELENVIGERDKYKADVTERDNQIETLKKSAGDNEELKKQIETLQADNKSKDEKHAAEIKQLKINTAVESALTGAKAKNNLAVRALLKDLDKAELQEDGTIKGLSEQITALQKSEAYLFEDQTGKKTQMTGAKPGESGREPGEDPVDVSKMTYSEIAAYMTNNPGAKID